jgi:uncharacterized protein (TIGR03435 family)
MTSPRLKPIGFAVLFLATTLAAQQSAAPSTPKFEVVSIRVVPPNTPPTMRDIDFTPVLPGGQYVDSRTILPLVIGFAYNVKNSSKHLVGLPNWANNQAYAVAAKPAQGFPALPPAENREQVRLMMRAMLAERFHLQLHTETRQEPIFNLEVAKGGFKIKEVDPPLPPDKEGYVGLQLSDSGGRMLGNKSTIAGIVSALTPWLPGTVVDQTGLKGHYDFDVRWNAPGIPEATGLGADGIALLISTLQERFGLRLTKTTGPAEYWVVDHIEPPTDN